MAAESYKNTNALLYQLSLSLERETSRHLLREVIENLSKSILEEREATQRQLHSLQSEINIKAYYIKELENLKGLTPKPKVEEIEKMERKLIHIITVATDALDSLVLTRANSL
jgi:ribosome-binding protein aMBF1 (putative translation factor)